MPLKPPLWLLPDFIVDLAILRADRLWPELAIDRVACGPMRTALVLQELSDDGGERQGLFPGHDHHVGPEQIVELQAARVVARDHRCARSQGLDRDRWQRL